MAFWDEKRLNSIVALAISCVFCCCLFCDEPSDKEKIILSLSLHDTKDAFTLLERWQQKDKNFTQKPENIALLFDYLAELQDIEGMRILSEKTEKAALSELPKTTLEHIAWANIESASEAYHPKLRAEALLAAAESQDVHGMMILKKMITDSHQGIQQIALQLAANYPDEPLQNAAKEIALYDLPEAKLSAARLLAVQKAPSAERVLQTLLTDDTLSEEDQVTVASLLSTLKDSVDLTWLQQAVVDERSAIRALAASSVLQCPSKEGLRQLLPLLSDPSVHVKKCAFQALGLWQSVVPEVSDQLIASLRQSLDSPSFDLSAVAAWALCINVNEDAKKEAACWFEKTLLTPTKGKSLIASSRLIATGQAGISIAKALITKVQDPLARLNLAEYLLFHKESIAQASDILKTTLSSTQTLLEEDSDGVFSWINTSHIPHHPAIPRLPESQDLFIRLQLLALRSYSGQPIQREEVEAMLNDRAWGISAAAAVFLFQEFGGSLDEVLTPLLSHETETIRIQAALILTLISQSQQGAIALAEQYEKASREGKEAILIGFSALPASRTKQYLLPLLFDPSPVLRTRASGAFLSSMYR